MNEVDIKRDELRRYHRVELAYETLCEMIDAGADIDDLRKAVDILTTLVYE